MVYICIYVHIPLVHFYGVHAVTVNRQWSHGSYGMICWVFVQKHTSLKTNMDTAIPGYPKRGFGTVDYFEIWQYLVSMSDFWGVHLHTRMKKYQPLTLYTC